MEDIRKAELTASTYTQKKQKDLGPTKETKGKIMSSPGRQFETQHHFLQEQAFQ